ncbi:LytR/AlgR family response regulator transcription factor [Paenibacillus tyrfis]|uniref:LytR/AlgR family response regulator transcription factor n=1 Tax=Paenibacillus tyrfis TaxID=1501230 RepID=UPI00209CF7C1|nr:LytTR family DNA-binding domain-containing protein [Paenibacillus tyrfis]MCP1307745.1 LytTR family DNA-binding domain-containing protein [Paenibacillus tyrfis]
MKVMIAEDERLAREELTYLLSRERDVELLPFATSGVQLLELATVHKPDIVFLDIHMPGLDGVQTAHKLMDVEPRPYIVFATAYEQYAVEAFRLEAADYLLKPYDEERLRQTLQRIRKMRAPSEGTVIPSAAAAASLAVDGASRSRSAFKPKLLIDDGSRMVVVEPAKISYAVKEEKLTQIHMADGQVHMTRQTLQELEEKLTGYAFFRTHRSYLVNVDRIDEIEPWFNGAYNVVLKDAGRSKVPLSRVAAKELIKRLQGE